MALADSGAAGLPSGAAVVHGAAQIRSDGTAMQIRQDTARLVTDWQRFSIGAGQSVQFLQPSANAVALNRVVGADPSAILGQLTANGHVYLQNPNGVLFAPGAQVDVGSLVATTLRIDVDAFLGGRLRLGGDGSAAGVVANQGSLRAAPGGHVLLAGPQVVNGGSIEAPGGQIGLVAAQGVTVDPTGSGLLDIRVTAAALGARLEHSGRSVADAGRIDLQAAALDAARRTVMQVDGVLRAQRVEQRGGQIVLSGGDRGVVQVDAHLDASSADGAGGAIRVLGEAVALVGQATLDASGATGGGEILVGGNLQGRGPEANARATFVGQGVSLDASATQRGDGGRIIVWSDGHTAYGGQLRATGGPDGGNGGFAEVSGKQSLAYQGGADLRAAHGRTGTLLLDPDFIVVGADADLNGDATLGDDLVNNVLLGSFPGATSLITAGRLADQLATADVTLQAALGIDINTAVNVSVAGADTLLTLDAPGLSINAALNLNHTALAMRSAPGFSDSVFIDAPISTLRSVSIDAQSITLWSGAALNADSVSMRSTVDGSGSVFQRLTSSIAANSVVFGQSGAAFGSIGLNGGNNQMHGVTFQATGSARIENANDGYTFSLSGSAGSLTLLAGTGVMQTAPLTIAGTSSLTTTGLGALSLNHAGNSFGGIVDVYATGDLSLRAAGGLSVRGLVNGNAVLVAGGLFTLAGNLTAYGSTGIDITGAGFDNGGNWDLTTPNGFFYVTSTDFTQDDLGGMTFGGVPIDCDIAPSCYVSTPSQFNFISFDYQNAVWVGGKFAYNGNGYFTNRPAALAIVEPVSDAYTDYNGSTDNYTGLYLVSGTTFAPVSGSELTYVYGRSLLDDKNAGTEKGFTLLSGTDSYAYGSNGTRYYGLNLSGYVRPPGPPTSGYGESTVNPASLYIEGLFADKTYDGTVTATLDGSAYVTPYGSDDVALDGSPTVGDFDDKNVGYKTLIVSGLSISGADANNYTFIPEIYPYIYQAPLAVTGISAVNKVYDASTYINFTGTPVLAAPLGSDDVSLVD
ncbi:MAG: filamentous hemagglutinin N-terminal domain-containing protein, partial [Rubrivivax sp.]